MIAGLFYSAIAFAQFRIEGNLGKETTGKVYLLSGKDTLGQTDVRKGKFTLKGKIGKPQVAFLWKDGEKYTTPIFLEEAGFKVVPGQLDRTLQITGSGRLQQQQQEYRNAFQGNEAKIRKAEEKLKDAKKKQSLFEVMMWRAELEMLDSVRNDIENRFIARYPNSLVSLYHFYTNLRNLDYAQLSGKYDLLGKEMKQTEWGKMITARYENRDRIAVGNIAPDFTLDTPEGEKVSFYEVKAKVKILDFWASWCGPCRAESPNIMNVYHKYKDSGLEIVSVSLDTKVASWKKAIETDGLPWVHVSSLQGWKCPIASLYRIQGVPAIFILDSDNRIVAMKVRGEEIEKIVSKLFDAAGTD